MARALVNIPSSGTIGEVKASMLTLAQFQAQFGTNWVLANGASASGTAYATITGNTTLPDCRGVGLRGKNNGRADGNQNPDGDLALGTYQGDVMGSHAHSTLTGTRNNIYGLTGTTRGLDASGFTSNVQNIDYGASSGQLGITSTGGNETRMKNVTVNYFIKVN